MNKASFYPKLAFQNIKNNRKFYIPYMLTGIVVVMMFYIINFLANQDSLGYKYADGGVYGGQYLSVFLVLGTVIIALFSVIFLFYTNSFLIKRRQKEFGLYIVLGMEKRHLSIVQFYETLYAAAVSIIGGLLCGVLFSKLAMLLCCNILRFETPMGFSVSLFAVGVTVAVFLVIYFLILLRNIVAVGRAKPVELLHAGNAGEKEPKSKWILTILGALCLGGGYAIAILVKSPLSAIFLFFVAVVLVIVGTYLLFTTGSVTLLKALKNNKKYYYQTRHFVSVSGMIYRMKQNAVGLANICILSTMVLVMLSSTIALNVGMEDVLSGRYPTDIMVYYTGAGDEVVKYAPSYIEEYCKSHGCEPQDLYAFKELSFAVSKTDNGYDGKKYSAGSNIGEIGIFDFITDEEYSRRTGESVSLADGEMLAYSDNFDFDGSIRLMGNEYTVKETLKSFPASGASTAIIADYSYFVVNDATLQAIYEHQNEYYTDESSLIDYNIYFDLELPDSEQVSLCENLRDSLSGEDFNAYISSAIGQETEQSFSSMWAESRAESDIELYGMYGSFLFLGIFLGILFIMAAILIMYYKQLTEGYNDKERFEIMQKVGLSREEIKKSIRSQILVVFFLPLATAVLHMVFAFRIITKLLSVLSLTNVSLFVICTICTIAVFAIIYAIVYALTAKEYYKIVSKG